MNPIYFWLVCYIMPVILVISYYIIFKPKKIIKRIITHIGLFVSILLSQYFILYTERIFSFKFSIISISLFVISVIIAYLVIGKIGLLYSISAFLQQLTMISITFLLLPFFKLYFILILVVPIYAITHLQEKRYAITKLFLTAAWGVISILLFIILKDIYFPIALHILGGIFLLKNGIIYPRKS